MTVVDEIRIYPIKSLGSIALSEAVVEERGLRYDRRFILVSPKGPMLTQRTYPQLALLDVAIDGMPAVTEPAAPTTATLRIWHRQQPDNALTLPLVPTVTDAAERVPVSVWDSAAVAAVAVSAEADRWFSALLQTPCRLLYMPDAVERPVREKYALPAENLRPNVSFADGVPFLLISRASLDDLNRRLPEPVGMNRFRPNLVIGGDLAPHEEDTWAEFRLGGVGFRGVKPCIRCVMTTIDPATAQKGKEPLRTLATYRNSGGGILFGQNVLGLTTGILRVGDRAEVLSRLEP